MIAVEQLAAELWASVVPGRTPAEFANLASAARLRWMRAARRALELVPQPGPPPVPKDAGARLFAAFYPSGGLVTTRYNDPLGLAELTGLARQLKGTVVSLGTVVEDYRESGEGNGTAV